MDRRVFVKTGAAFLAVSSCGEPVALTLENTMSKRNEMNQVETPLTYDDVHAVSPALEHYTKATLLNGLWKRPELSPRDRSMVTVAALIARIQTMEFSFHFNLALDNGVKPAELSEVITHLAFYAGWANAMAAIVVAKDIFRSRGIGVDQLPPANDKLLPLNEEAEKQRSTLVGNNFGHVSPGLVQNTTDVLFRDLWLRSALAPRDRSLITMSALIANGQTAQIPFHLNRAMDNGLTQEQAAEVLTHIAFYAGWPCAMSALPVAKEVFEKRHSSGPQGNKRSVGMTITHAGSMPSMVGSADWFTGNVRVDSLFPADGGRRSNGGMVTFEPGARTRWHTHPAGQTILITQGLGWVQKQGEAIQEVRPGDVVFFAPGEKHWHGASANVGMVHIAITEVVDGKAVDWLEPVNDNDYAKGNVS